MQALRAPVCLGWLCLLVACADHKLAADKSAADKPTAVAAPSKETKVT